MRWDMTPGWRKQVAGVCALKGVLSLAPSHLCFLAALSSLLCHSLQPQGHSASWHGPATLWLKPTEQEGECIFSPSCFYQETCHSVKKFLTHISGLKVTQKYFIQKHYLGQKYFRIEGVFWIPSKGMGTTGSKNCVSVDGWAPESLSQCFPQTTRPVAVTKGSKILCKASIVLFSKTIKVLLDLSAYRS